MISQFKSKVGALAQKFGRFTKQKSFKMKAKSALAKTKKFASQNKKAIAVGAGAAGLGGVYGYSKGKKEGTKQAIKGVSGAYLLGKNSNVKGNYRLDIAPKFRAITESKSKKNIIKYHSKNKTFLKETKTPNLRGAILNKRKS